ncbi:MAG TPA: sulfotransferase [Xanthomonadales bacterium]|nr:sulfotransferase [Xanthomonadales bacterium]
MKTSGQARSKQAVPTRTLDLGPGYFDLASFRFRRYGELRPNLLLLGAQKCGTTSLANYLSYHPEIHLSSPLKEAGFYLFDEWAGAYWNANGWSFKNPKELLRKGMLNGYTGQRYFVDAATWYTIPAISGGVDVAENLAGKVEKAIFSVRNPFDRMVSAYKNFHARKANVNFNACLNSDPSLLQICLYFEQLQRYIEALGAENICVVVFEDFIADVPSTLNRIAGFLGLEEFLPFTDYPVMNSARNLESYRYSSDNFERLQEAILPDVARLEAYLGRPIGWDLSTASWLEVF